MKTSQATRHSGISAVLRGGLLALLLGGGLYCWHRSGERPVGPMPESRAPVAERTEVPDLAVESGPGESAAPLPSELVFQASHRIQELAPEVAALPQNSDTRYFLSNPGQDTTARFLNSGGVLLRSGLEGSAWQGSLQLSGGDGEWRADGCRIERAGDGLTEWYENKVEGIEHGFTLFARQPDSASETVTLDVRLEGLRAEIDPAREGDLRFIDPESSAPVLGYRGLKVWDSSGRTLAAAMVPSAEGIRFSIHTAGASYPITIDPVIVTLESKKPGPNTGASAGMSVDISETLAVVGMPGANTAVATNAGAVAVFRKSGGSWLPDATLIDPSGAAGDGFGNAVALGGNRIAVGAPYNDEGAATDAGSILVFHYNETTTTWTQQYRRVNGTSQFGRSLAVDADLLVVGAPTATVGSLASAGQVYLYEFSTGTYLRALTSGTAVANAQFGHVLAASSGRIAVGEPYVTNGRAWIFRPNLNTYLSTQLTTPAEVLAGEQFGHAVGLSDDFAAVSAVRRDGDRGKVYGYLRNGNAWSNSTAVTAPGATAWYHYGHSLDMTADFLAVGALWADPIVGGTTYFDAGSVYLYKRNGGTLDLRQTLVPSDRAGSDVFGTSVAISSQYLIGGAPGVKSGAAANFGAAYIHAYQGTDDVDTNIRNSNLLASPPTAEQLVAIRSVAGKEGFRVSLSGSLRRLDAVDLPLPSPAPADDIYFPTTLDVNFRTSLTDSASGQLIPLVGGGLTTQSVTMGAFTPTATGRQAVLLPIDRTLSLVPVDPSLVLPNRSYQITVTVDHHDGIGTRVDYTRTFTNLEPISLNGKLRFGSIDTTITAVANNPAAGSVTGSGGLFFLQLTLPAGAGRVTDRPAQTFGGGPLTVIYVSTGPQQGDLAVYAGTVPLAGAAEGSSSGVRWTRGPVLLGKDGAVAQNFRVIFPAGLGLAQNVTTGRLKSSALVDVQLSPDLQPEGSTAIYPTSGDVMYVVHERLPHRMEVKGLSWNIDAGIFTPDWKAEGFVLKHVREDENEYLKNNGFPLVNEGDRIRMSNDRYLYGDATGQEIVIRTSPGGRALLDGTVKLKHAEYVSHFPKGLPIPDGDTTVTFESSRVASGTMVQAYINPIPLSYSTVAGNAPNCLNPALATRTVNFTPGNQTWQITPDGGLRTGGSIQSADVSWGLNASGQFAHTVQSVTTGVMHLAGTALSADVYGPVPNDGAGYLPAAMLLSGHGSPTNAALVERPFTKGYDSGADATSAELAAAGRADYPGFNFRVGTTGGLTAVSHLAGEDVGPYGLKAHGKYYIRRSGVTGVHDAVTADIDPLPPFYGYDMKLSQLTLSFLDTRNHDSVNTGSIVLPAPSGFTLDFKDLVFTSTGELERADLVNPGIKHLIYWDTDLRPAAMEFASLDDCVPGSAFLVLSVTAVMPAITDDPLQGRLGFTPEGTLVSASESGQSGVDSRFVLPSVITLKGVEGGVGAEGVEGSTYSFTPVTKAALNSYNAGESSVGFLSFAGGLSVPFFEDIPVHIHATPSVAGSPGSLYHVMGGWSVTDPDGRVRNFFNDANFDPGNRGYPDTVPPFPLEDYRRNIRNEYQPVAHRNWRGIADLDYRLVWDATSRTFVSGDDDDDHDPLLILTVDHQVQKLTSRGCAITFGTGFTTPQLNVGTLAAEALSGGLRDALPNPEDLLGGIDELEKLVTDRFERTIGTVLEDVLSASAEGIVDDLDTFYATRPAGATGFSGLTTAYLNQRNTAIADSLKGLGANGGAVFNQINDALDGAIHSCDLALNIIGTKDQRATIMAVVKGLSAVGGGEAISSVPDDLMEHAEDGLQQVQEVIEAAKARLQALKGDAAMVQRIQGAFTQAGDLAARNAIARIVESYRAERDITGNYMAEFSRAEHKARVMGLLRQSISGGALAEAVQPILRGTFSEIRSQFRGALDLMFAEVNRLLNRTLKELVDDGIAEFKDMVGASEGGSALGSTAAGVGDFCATARVDGYAQINGEEIKEIRLNSRLKMKLAASLTVDGWFHLLNLESGTPNSSGRPAGAVMTEITVGASAQASFGPTSVAVSLEGRFSFGPQFNLVGLDGSFDLRARMPVKQASFDRFAAKFGFGGGVGYVSGLVEGSVYFVDAQGACFFGTTRNPQDLSLIDQDTRRLLTLSGVTNGLLDQPLTGIYTGLEGDISVNRFFGIPDSCFLSLKAHLGLANFCFFQNRPDGAYLIPGVRYVMGASGRVVCLIGLSGEGAVAAKLEIKVDNLANVLSSPGSFLSDLTDSEATGVGRLTLRGEVGIGPFAVSHEETLRLTMVLSKENVDVDFE